MPSPVKNAMQMAWRVTLRCVVTYSKSAPQPVVATSSDLGGAMRLLEAQFAGSAGKGKAKEAQSSVRCSYYEDMSRSMPD